MSGCEMRLKELPMPDLDLIKQGKQGRGTGASDFLRAGRARPPGHRDHVNRGEGGRGMRFASDSLQVTARPAGGGGGTALIGLPPTSLSRSRSIPESILVRGRRNRPSA